MKTRAVNPASIEEWKLESVLASLLELADNQGRLLCPPFRVLESKEEFPLYHERIKNPIDLRTIGKKIRNGEYSSWSHFDVDIKLLIRNAKAFNEPGSTIFKDAGRILIHYNKACEDVIQPGFKLSQAQIKHNHGLVTGLLESGSSEPDNLSEDSEEDEDTEAAEDPKWMLYWRIRNFDVIDGFPLCTHFLELPSKKCYPDYYEEIEKPISLYMINKMLKRNEIKTLQELIAYLQQMFRNARSYNIEESEIYEAANTLERLTVDAAKELDATLDVQLSECFLEDQEEEKPKVGRRERIMNARTGARKGRRPVRRSRKRGRKTSENSTSPSLYDDSSLRIKSEFYLSESMDYNDDSSEPPRKRRLGRPRRDEKMRPGRKVRTSQVDFEETVIPSVQAEVRRLLNDLFQSVISYKDSKGRCLSDWLIDIHDLLRKVNAEPKEFPFTLEEMKVNLQKNRYLRLDRFQEDLFALFGKAREYTKANSEIYNVTVELQRFFINKRDELCKNCLKSPAMLYNESLMNGEIEDLEKRKRQRTRQKSVTTDAEEAKSKSSLDGAPSSSDDAKDVKKTKKDDIAASASPSSDAVEDSTGLLDVNRYDVPEHKKSALGSGGQGGSDVGIVYYQQLEHNGKYYQLGNGVLVFREGKSHCDVIRIGRMWRNADGEKFLSGALFVRPTELVCGSSEMFYKREVIGVEQQDVIESFANVQAKCAVIATKQHDTCRPTEIPECDVFVVNFKVPGNVGELSKLTAKNCSLVTSMNVEDRMIPGDGELNFHYARPCRRLKTYKLSVDVIEDEVFYFKTPIVMQKSFLPQMMTTYSTLSVDHSDLDNESQHLDDMLDGSQSKELQDASWLATQPKLNAKSKSGYILFSAEVRKRIMNENPEAGFGEVSKIVGVEWKKLSSESKRQYEARAQFIAEERAKAEPTTPSCKPGQVFVYVCRWERCDFSFNSQEGLHEHIRTSHAINVAQEFTTQRPGHKLDPLSESKSDTQYVCMWSGCNKFRRDGKPFPTLPKMLRHVKEKHLNTSVRAMDPEQRPKNYFVYYTPEQLQYHVGGTSAAIKANEPGRFVHYPYGIQPQAAIACTVATPILAPSRANSPSRNLPQTPTYVSNGVGYQMAESNAVPQAYGHTPTSMHQSYAYASHPSVSSTTGVVAHQQYSQQPAINGAVVGEGAATYSVQPMVSTAAAHQQPHSAVDVNRIVQSPGGYVTNATSSRPGEPVYITQPGNSVHVKRVVHPEYVMNYYVYYTPEQMQQYAGANGVPPAGAKPNDQGRFAQNSYVVQPAATPTAAGHSPSRAGSPSRLYQQQSSTNAAPIPHATAYATNGVNHSVAPTHVSAQSYGTPTSSQHYMAFSQPSVSSAIPQQQQSYQINGTPATDAGIFSQQAVHHQPVAIDAGRAIIQSPNHVASTSGPVFAAPPNNSVQVQRVLHSEAYVKYIESLYSSKQQRTVSKWDNALMANHRNTSTNHRKLPYDWVRKISPAFVASLTTNPLQPQQNGDALTAAAQRAAYGAPMSARAAKAAAREARAREKDAANTATSNNGYAASGTTSKEEQEVIRSLWRLRDQLLESTTSIQRAATVSIDH